jgi:hypothetical protein
MKFIDELLEHVKSLPDGSPIIKPTAMSSYDPHSKTFLRRVKDFEILYVKKKPDTKNVTLFLKEDGTVYLTLRTPKDFSVNSRRFISYDEGCVKIL